MESNIGQVHLPLPSQDDLKLYASALRYTIFPSDVITVKTRRNCIKHSRASDVVKYHTGSSSNSSLRPQLDISGLFYIIPPSDVNIKTRKN